MTHKTETALDLDGLAASGFTEGPWSHVNGVMAPDFVIRGNELHDDVQIVCGSVGAVEIAANSKLIAAAPSLLSLAISQRDQIAAKDARIRELELELTSLRPSKRTETRLECLQKRAATIKWEMANMEAAGRDWEISSAMRSALVGYESEIAAISAEHKPNQSKRKDG